MLPLLTHQERETIKNDKRIKLLSFLASGEIYTTSEIVSLLLNLSRPRAFACLQALVRDKCIKSEVQSVNARNIKIFGITPHGLAVVDKCGQAHFELGRTNPSWIAHRLDSQRMRIKAEQVGWTNWQTDRVLREAGLKKIPDAIALNPINEIIAIEIERFAKTPKRYSEIIVTYLLEIKANKYHEVHFVSPKGISRLIKNAFNKIEYVKVNGQEVMLEEKHRAKFKFFEFDNWIEK